MGKIQNLIWETFRFVVLTLAIVVPIRTFIAQPFVVAGASMVPTFQNNDYLIVDELSYYLRAPARGEVIVFRYPKDETKHFIKRIIGLPGETVITSKDGVEIKTTDNKIIKLDETYLPADDQIAGDKITELALGPNDYFVMGDNRNNSSDSRIWGALPQKLITGRVLVRLLPFGKVSVNF